MSCAASGERPAGERPAGGETRISVMHVSPLSFFLLTLLQLRSPAPSLAAQHLHSFPCLPGAVAAGRQSGPRRRL